MKKFSILLMILFFFVACDKVEEVKNKAKKLLKKKRRKKKLFLSPDQCVADFYKATKLELKNQKFKNFKGNARNFVSNLSLKYSEQINFASKDRKHVVGCIIVFMLYSSFDEAIGENPLPKEISSEELHQLIEDIYSLITISRTQIYAYKGNVGKYSHVFKNNAIATLKLAKILYPKRKEKNYSRVLYESWVIIMEQEKVLKRFLRERDFKTLYDRYR